MDRIATDCRDLSYSGQAPVFVVANSDRALANALRTVEYSGHRAAASTSLEDAPERIKNQAAASAVWLELDGDGEPDIDRLAEHLRRDLDEGRYGAVISTTAVHIDPMFSAFGDSNAVLLVEADEGERAAALALAATALDRSPRLSDIASDASSVRLRQLSEEVNRIAATLARLSATPPPLAGVAAAPDSAELPPVAVETVRSIIRARRLRARFFAEDLFADPAWDMLLDLMAARLERNRVAVSSLCIAAAVPPTTALRWIKALTEKGLFVRRADPADGRRVYIELSDEAARALAAYLRAANRISPIGL